MKSPDIDMATIPGLYSNGYGVGAPIRLQIHHLHYRPENLSKPHTIRVRRIFPRFSPAVKQSGPKTDRVLAPSGYQLHGSLSVFPFKHSTVGLTQDASREKEVAEPQDTGGQNAKTHRVLQKVSRSGNWPWVTYGQRSTGNCKGETND